MREPLSTNERAERLMGRRLTPEQEAGGVLPIDLPCELGFWCPVHQETYDEGLHWSEYASFLWCERCNRDYPSALCVPVPAPEGAEYDGIAGYRAGIDAAVDIYLDTVEAALTRAATEARSDAE